MKWLFEVIAAVGVVLGAIRVIYDMTTVTRSRLKEDYLFAKGFLKSLEQEPGTHHLVIDRGYYALAGTTAITVAEIAYLISLTHPDKSLRNYIAARKYLQIMPGNYKVEFRKKYKNPWSRSWRKSVHLFMYLMGAGLSMSPLILQKPLGLEPTSLFMMAATVPSFGFLAFDSLRNFMKIRVGEELVRDQNVHVQKFIV